MGVRPARRFQPFIYLRSAHRRARTDRAHPLRYSDAPRSVSAHSRTVGRRRAGRFPVVAKAQRPDRRLTARLSARADGHHVLELVGMEQLIDLRSDTVTKPSAAMRAAMAAAEVGDDVSGGDPTVLALERETATALGKEAALFVASGTMGNLVSVLAHCERGDEAIVGDEAHLYFYEAAGSSAFGGVQLRTVPNRQGAIDPADVERAIRTDNVH